MDEATDLTEDMRLERDRWWELRQLCEILCQGFHERWAGQFPEAPLDIPPKPEGEQ